MRIGELAFSRFSFQPLVRCNATSGALRELASALRTGIAAADRCLRDAHADARFELSTTTRVVHRPERRTSWCVHLSVHDVLSLADGLAQLADFPGRSSVTLYQLGLLTPATSELNLEFCKMEVQTLSRDYEPHTSGSTWEAVLKEYLPSVDRLLEAREVLLRWCLPTGSGEERDVFVDTAEDSILVPAGDAFDRLLDPGGDVSKVCVYFDHPLVIPFASRFTGAQCWFEAASTESILSENCVATGDYYVDIQNFFRYRALLVGWCDVLGSQRIGWGEVADGWPDDRYVNPNDLDDPQKSWRCFCDNFTQENDDWLELLPPWVHDEFVAQFDAAPRLARSRPA